MFCVGMQACLFGARGMEGLLVLGTYTARLLSALSEHRVLFAYVPEVPAPPSRISEDNLHVIVLYLDQPVRLK